MSESLLIECEPPHQIVCECCQENIIRLTRFVYQDNHAFAYYYAHIEPHHHDFVKCLVVICEFDATDEIIHKIGFPLVLWDNNGLIATTLLNADEIVWQNLADVAILNRENALMHPYQLDVFRISDEILEQDKEIMNFFGKC